MRKQALPLERCAEGVKRGNGRRAVWRNRGQKLGELSGGLGKQLWARPTAQGNHLDMKEKFVMKFYRHLRRSPLLALSNFALGGCSSFGGGRSEVVFFRQCARQRLLPPPHRKKKKKNKNKKNKKSLTIDHLRFLYNGYYGSSLNETAGPIFRRAIEGAPASGKAHKGFGISGRPTKAGDCVGWPRTGATMRATAKKGIPDASAALQDAIGFRAWDAFFFYSQSHRRKKRRKNKKKIEGDMDPRCNSYQRLPPPTKGAAMAPVR